MPEENNAAKIAIKVAGDWELEVNGNPYGADSDNQYFDPDTEIVSGADMPVVYYHSISDDNQQLAPRPIIIGKATRPERRADGVWWRVILDKGIEEARKVWEAAKEGLAVASSGAIDYLSRLEINGKLLPYSKDQPGRIAVWHMGELSLWDRNGHRPQAHPHAIAIPAMKAAYEKAGLPIPKLYEKGEPENDEQGRRAAKIARANLLKRSREIIKRSKKYKEQ